VTRFNLAAAPRRRRGSPRRWAVTPPTGWPRCCAAPIPQRLRDVGFDRAKIDFVATEMAAMAIATPRKVSAEDVRTLLAAAY
jgi:hypothetical protein